MSTEIDSSWGNARLFEEIESLRAQLAASQAREQHRIEALEAYRGQIDQYGKHSSVEALAIPSDDTALKQWGAKLLRKEAGKINGSQGSYRGLSEYGQGRADAENAFIDQLTRRANELDPPNKVLEGRSNVLCDNRQFTPQWGTITSSDGYPDSDGPAPEVMKGLK